MKCLSLYQPWASLMAAGVKRVETRSWATPHRGPLLIHASRTWTRELVKVARLGPAFKVALEAMGVTWTHGGGNRLARPSLQLGAVIGRVEVVECFRTEDLGHIGFDAATVRRPAGGGPISVPLLIDDTERAFGDYTPRRWAWLCENAVTFPVPIPVTGRQGLFEVPDALIPPTPSEGADQ